MIAAGNVAQLASHKALPALLAKAARHTPVHRLPRLYTPAIVRLQPSSPRYPVGSEYAAHALYRE
ncbi:hypothetical protein D1872_336120 [compost metagenome]